MNQPININEEMESRQSNEMRYVMSHDTSFSKFRVAQVRICKREQDFHTKILQKKFLNI